MSLLFALSLAQRWGVGAVVVFAFCIVLVRALGLD